MRGNDTKTLIFSLDTFSKYHYINTMHSLKMAYLYGAIIFIFLFLTPFSFAVPGQLIYDAGTPQTDNSQCTEALSTCQKESENNNSLYKTCLLQQSQQEKSITTLTNNLNQEKKNVFVMKLLLGIVTLSSIVVMIFLVKRGKKQYEEKK